MWELVEKKQNVPRRLIRSGLAVNGVVGGAVVAVRAVKEAMSRAARSWAASLGRIFEVDAEACARIVMAAVKEGADVLSTIRREAHPRSPSRL